MAHISTRYPDPLMRWLDFAPVADHNEAINSCDAAVLRIVPSVTPDEMETPADLVAIKQRGAWRWNGSRGR